MRPETGKVSERDVDEYLAALNQPQRGALDELRQTILEIIPDAEQCIAYGVPTFKIEGRAVAGFAAFKDHISYFPHSGSVLSQLPDDTAGYATSKGTLQFVVDKPLSKALVKKLISVRMSELPKP